MGLRKGVVVNTLMKIKLISTSHFKWDLLKMEYLVNYESDPLMDRARSGGDRLLSFLGVKGASVAGPSAKKSRNRLFCEYGASNG